MDPTTKRIKLSLEPCIEKTAIDITETGHEVHKTDITLSEQLMRNVDRVWYERGDWKDITEESLKRKMAEDELQDTTTPAITAGTLQDISIHQEGLTEEKSHNVDLAKLRESVISKLYFAKCEIDVALDVINILATENKPNTSGVTRPLGSGGDTLGNSAILNGGLLDSSSSSNNNNLVLPPRTLHATYVSKPKPTEKSQLEQAQLTLGLKRNQQKTAADYLKKSAASLKNLVDHEQRFWNEAVKVRSNHWLMQASWNQTIGESGFMIRYGFTDVGSDFGEVSFGEMLRADQSDSSDKKQQVQLVLPHNVAKQVRVTIRQNQTVNMSSSNALNGMLGTNESSEKQDDNNGDIYLPLYKPEIDDIQKQLIDAQSSVFDSELFSRILAEAQVFPNNVQCEEDCLILTLDGQVDILIQKVQQAHEDHERQQLKSTTTVSSQQLVGRTIEMALRLLLTQRHRFNLWKSRARLMASQRKTQQLFNSISDTVSLPGPGVGTQGSTSLAGTGIGSAQTITAGVSASSVGASSGGASTPILGKRATGSSIATGVSSPSSLLAGNISRQLHAGGAYREPLSDVPILAPVLSMTKFWTLCNRVRDVAHSIIDPLCGEAGLGLAVHFRPQHVFNNNPHGYYDAYPSFGELTTSLAINVFKGPSLRFALNQSGTITATLPDSTVTLTNVTEFESFLLREIKLICLHMVCDIANFLIQRSVEYKNAKGNERGAFIWQVDEVEETLCGAIKVSKLEDTVPQRHWKYIQVQIHKTTLTEESPAYVLQFKEVIETASTTVTSKNEQTTKGPQPSMHYIILSRWYDDDDMENTKHGVRFNDKVAVMIKRLLV